MAGLVRPSTSLLFAGLRGLRSPGSRWRPPRDRGAKSGRLFRPLCSVLRSALLAVLDALRIEHTAEDMVANAGEVFHAAAADHDDRVFLQVMPFAGDIADDLEAVGEADLGDLAERRVRLLRRRRVDARADAALLRALLHRRHLVPPYRRLARLANELINRRHSAAILAFTK